MSGFTDPADDSSLTSAVIRAALNKAAPVGAMMDYLGTTAPTGWVLGAGKTIGSVASSGTERANADTEDLFTLLWTNFTNTELVIQDSAGSQTTRGISAAADFAANKRMPTPDLRGRTAVGLDNMGGSSANRITATEADTIGKATGTETHTLVEAEMPAHVHTGAGGTALVSNQGPGPTVASTMATASTGGGGAHANVQPTFFTGKIIKL